jgi:hypothetical protein
MRFFTERRVLYSSYDRGIRATDLLHTSVPCDHRIDHRWYGRSLIFLAAASQSDEHSLTSIEFGEVR